jgi:hypothetical protein
MRLKKPSFRRTDFSPSWTHKSDSLPNFGVNSRGGSQRGRSSTMTPAAAPRPWRPPFVKPWRPPSIRRPWICSGCGGGGSAQASPRRPRLHRSGNPLPPLRSMDLGSFPRSLPFPVPFQFLTTVTLIARCEGG